MNNLEGKEKFLGTYNLTRPNHEEIENLNRPIASKEIELIIIINSQKIKAQDQMVSLMNSTKYLETN